MRVTIPGSDDMVLFLFKKDVVLWAAVGVRKGISVSCGTVFIVPMNGLGTRSLEIRLSVGSVFDTICVAIQ